MTTAVKDGNKCNLIDKWVEVVSDLTEAPIKSIRAAGYWLTAALLAENVVIYGTPYNLRPNIYVVISGAPALGHKSTLISYAVPILIDVLGEEVFFNRYIESGSVEGALDAIEAGGVMRIYINSHEA